MPRKKDFNCTLCDKIFTLRQNLFRHVRAVHEKIQPFACTVCGKKFGEKANQKRHEQSVHHKKIIQPFACTICGKKFSVKSNQKRHERLVHHNAQRPSIECIVSGKTFGHRYSFNKHTKKDLKNHKALVRNKEKTEKVSSTLKKEVKKKISVKRNLKIHNNRNNFRVKRVLVKNICEICGRNFSFRQSLYRHVRTLHIRSKASDSKIISQQYSDIDLRRQLRVVLSEISFSRCSNCNVYHLDGRGISECAKVEELISDVGLSFQCEICDEKFDDEKILARHAEACVIIVD